MNIVGVAKADIFSPCVFNNIVGVACIFNSPFFSTPALSLDVKAFYIIHIHFSGFRSPHL